jgi:hypothetical protein
METIAFVIWMVTCATFTWAGEAVTQCQASLQTSPGIQTSTAVHATREECEGQRGWITWYGAGQVTTQCKSVPVVNGEPVYGVLGD